MNIIIVVLPVLLLAGAFPTGGYGLGNGVPSVLVLVLLIVLILFAMGRI